MITMYIGMNDKDLHRQVLDDSVFFEAIARYIEGCTIFEAKGLYKGEFEKSLKLEIYDDNEEKYINIAKTLCRELNQETIIINGKIIAA